MDPVETFMGTGPVPRRPRWLDLALAMARYATWLVGPFVPIVVVWEVVGRLEVFPPYVFPPASAVAVSFWDLLRSGELFVHIWYSLLRLGMGFVAGAVLGLPLGILMGMSRRVATF